MAEVKWIKLQTDMFDNRKIKHLRKLPDGNNIVLIWVMLLTMAGRCNAGGMIFLTQNIPYDSKMLADEMDMEENTVKMALTVFEQMGMISHTETDFLFINGWEEYQNTDRLAELREYNRLAQQRHREKQKQLNDVNDMSMTSQSCQDIDIDIDKDIDKERDKDISKERHHFTPPTLDQVIAYCKERQNNIDAEYFLDYYQARGWYLSNGKKCRDWKSCVRTWERNNKNNRFSPPAQKRLSDIDERQNDYGQILKSLPNALEDF